jgi:hypothetical protein
MGEAEKKDEVEKFIPVGPGAEGLNEAEEKDEKEPEDKRLAQSDEEPEEGDADAEKDRPQRRRESAKERRERLKKQHARERTEREFLLKRNEELEKRWMAHETRLTQTETAAIDQRINSVSAQLHNADRVIAEALKKPNGAGAEEFVEAQKIRDELRDQLSSLKTAKTYRDSEVSRQKTQMAASPSEPKPDPRVLRNARDWASNHKWFDFNGNDEDSVIVRALDESLAGEGYDPASEEYWEELTERVKRRLPEKFKKGAHSRPDDEYEDEMDDEDDKPRPKSGPKFSSGGRERPLKKGEVYVSAERKQAMKEYGVWDDAASRNRMLKKYAQWDAEVAASNKR